MSRKGMVMAGVALLGIGFGVGAIAVKYRWIGGHSPQRITVNDCNQIQLGTPFNTWWLIINQDGSAILEPGQGIDHHLGGFANPTSWHGDRAKRCNLPASSFDFAAISQNFAAKSTPPMDWSKRDRLCFVFCGLTETASLKAMRHVQAELARNENLPITPYWQPQMGYVDNEEAGKLFDSARVLAMNHKLWPDEFEAIWADRPFPWSESIGRPQHQWTWFGERKCTASYEGYGSIYGKGDDAIIKLDGKLVNHGQGIDHFRNLVVKKQTLELDGKELAQLPAAARQVEVNFAGGKLTVIADGASVYSGALPEAPAKDAK